MRTLFFSIKHRNVYQIFSVPNAAFIQGWRIFRNHIFKSLKSVIVVVCKNNYIMLFKCCNVALNLLRQNRKYLDGVNYQFVPRFSLLSSNKRRVPLIRCGVCSRAAFNRTNTVFQIHITKVRIFLSPLSITFFNPTTLGSG